MFDVVFRREARAKLKRLRRFDAVPVLESIERYLREEPERTSRTSIRRLRGRHDATYRLRVQDYRVFYDVVGDRVKIVTILHKSETPSFYRRAQ